MTKNSIKYLNVGCGSYYSTSNEWINLDFVSTNNNIIAHNILKGLPFKDNSFDAVYHSHVLEHFSLDNGKFLISECFRVLKEGGVLRIVVPDLEKIVRLYLELLEKGIKNPEDEINRANYNWSMLLLYDQTTRNYRGGEMGKYLRNPNMLNREFIEQQIGDEVKVFKEDTLFTKKNILSQIKSKIKNLFYKLFNINSEALEIGQFRLSGEIHSWMYDRYSLTTLLNEAGFHKIEIKDAFNSNIQNWSLYNFDVKNGKTRIPESIFIEATKLE